MLAKKVALSVRQTLTAWHKLIKITGDYYPLFCRKDTHLAETFPVADVNAK